MTTATQILLATTTVSLVSLIGAFFLSVREAVLQQLTMLMVAFAAGGLIGGAFFHLLPEAVSISGTSAFPLTGFGILVFFALDTILSLQHRYAAPEHVHAFTYLTLIGDGIHNFLDGALIAGAFLANTKLGLITTALVIVHEVPHELGDFAVLIYGGFSRLQALGYNLLFALTAVLGGMGTYLFSLVVAHLQAPLLALSAGGFLYIALANLLPALQEEQRLGGSLLHLVLVLFGLLIVWAGTFLPS
jgi:zinc and cadmium transporter